MKVPLATGTLQLDVEEASWPLDELCDFATRRNPRRAFLVVSKVLGRHIPAAPSLMRRSMRDLAARLPDLPMPALVVGLAETAVCLGQGVHEELARRSGWSGLYMHSTRQQVNAPLLARFEEPHSHASAHLLYRPQSIDLAAVRSLVLVDDEISTGTTLTNLAAALLPHLPAAERIVAAALTDWSAGSDWLTRLPLPTHVASLLRGRLRWTAGATVTARDDHGFATAAPRLGTLSHHINSGRLGIAALSPIISPAITRTATRIRVIGTGEFTYPPFLLAEQLEQEGRDVVVQSTSRSPALPGGPIRHVLGFEDNYGTGLPNYLYNADPADARLSLICHETPAGSIDPAMIDALGAHSLPFGDLACAP